MRKIKKIKDLKEVIKKIGNKEEEWIKIQLRLTDLIKDFRR